MIPQLKHGALEDFLKGMGYNKHPIGAFRDFLKESLGKTGATNVISMWDEYLTSCGYRGSLINKEQDWLNDCFDSDIGYVNPLKGFSKSILKKYGGSLWVPSGGVVRRNLLTYSEQFDNAAWTKTNATVSANTTTASDGTLTADKLVEDATASTTHLAVISATFAASANTFSVFAKAGERSFVRVVMFDGTSAFASYFDLSSGAVGTTTGTVAATSTSIGNGWYRLSITATTSSGTGNVALRIASANNSDTYTGDGTSGIYIWGAQLEVGSSATDYQRHPFVTPSGCTVFEDSAGTTPAVKDGVVGKIADSVGSISATQATAGYKPILRKGAKNLLANSTPSGTLPWALSNTTASSDQFTTAITTAHVRYNALTVSPGLTYTFQFKVKRGSMTDLKYSVYNRTAESDIIAPTTYYSSTNASDFVVVSFSFITPAGCTSINLYPIRDSGATGTVYLKDAMLEIGSTASTYVATTSAPASNGVGNWWLDFDGTDDRLELSALPWVSGVDNYFIVGGVNRLTAADAEILAISNSALTTQHERLELSASNYVASRQINDAGNLSYDSSTFPAPPGTPVVASSRVATTNAARRNGVQSVSPEARVSAPITVNKAVIGANVSTTTTKLFQGPIYAIALGKGTITDAEILTVEKYVGQLSGVTI